LGDNILGHVAMLGTLWVALKLASLVPDDVRERGNILLSLREIFVEKLLSKTIRHLWYKFLDSTSVYCVPSDIAFIIT
jgi:hypothetical protein